MTPQVPTQQLEALKARAEDGALPPEAIARLRRERLDEIAAIAQSVLGIIAALVGLALSAVLVLRGPTVIGAILVGGIFLVGIMVAVPAARPWIIKIVERLPGAKDLPDDGEGQ